ncbi:Phospholipase C 3 [Escovopsis weberi]|uniref:Phospholipase C 3 n=1 Tax=Escovopsis weberi TaxID=150374 RepID=A0A0M8MZH3_ESCWE|nr:Phospholipase C 3 [Escovopsis weberi]
MPEIENFVYLMMENHSWDHVFGTLQRGGHDGLPLDSNGEPMTLVPQRYANGSIQRLYKMPKTCSGKANGPSQNWESSHNQWNFGAMDGWAIGGEQDKPTSLGYYTEDHLPVFHSLGKVFPINDRCHASTLAQTWPNRIFAFAGSARGIVKTGQTDDLVNVEYPNGIIVNHFDEHNISWTNYALPGSPGTLEHLFLNVSDELDRKHFKKFPEDFLLDAQKGTLPQFTFIDYNGSFQSMEPPQNVVEGEKVVWEVVTALMKGPKWSKTALVLTFDEHGGLYDHVPPAPAIRPDNVEPIIPADFRNNTAWTQYLAYDKYSFTGFRIPLLFISPYGKKDHISHVLHDHSSILSFLEHKFNLPALTCRDANANPLFDLLDFDAMERKKPNFPGSVWKQLSPPTTNPEYVNCTSDDPGMLPPPGTVVDDGTCSGPDFAPNPCGMGLYL